MEVDNTGGQRDGWIYIVTTQRIYHMQGTDPVPIDLNTLVAGETEYTPDMFKLYQNYPNPLILPPGFNMQLRADNLYH
ncbi:MAG: hypothetical protein EHM47_04135 [Ignavibacteriales bacterium]|nr:MAG: hypothetical protein EHM47_04135 [Ignavibacteriales bacterium]